MSNNMPPTTARDAKAAVRHYIQEHGYECDKPKDYTRQATGDQA